MMLQNRFTGLILLFDLSVGRTQDRNTGIQLRLPPLLSKNLIWTDVPFEEGRRADLCCPSPRAPRGANKASRERHVQDDKQAENQMWLGFQRLLLLQFRQLCPEGGAKKAGSGLTQAARAREPRHRPRLENAVSSPRCTFSLRSQSCRASLHSLTASAPHATFARFDLAARRRSESSSSVRVKASMPSSKKTSNPSSARTIPITKCSSLSNPPTIRHIRYCDNSINPPLSPGAPQTRAKKSIT